MEAFEKRRIFDKLHRYRYGLLDDFMAVLDRIHITDGEHVISDESEMAHLLQVSFDE